MLREEDGTPDFTEIVVLTAYLKEEMLLKLASKEVEGHLLKGINVNSLLEAIKIVHEGGFWIDEEIDAAAARTKSAPAQRADGGRADYVFHGDRTTRVDANRDVWSN